MSKELWKDYFKEEERLYELVNKYAKPIHVVEGFEPAFREFLSVTGRKLSKPPRWIRYFGLYKGSPEKLNNLLSDLQELHKLAVEQERNSNPPVRWPKIYQSIDRLTLSVNSAYQSIEVKEARVIEVRAIFAFDIEQITAIRDELFIDAEILRKVGIDAWVSQAVKNTAMGVSEVIVLNVQGEDLLTYFKANKLTARKQTGNQYVANIAEEPNSPAHKSSFGFILALGGNCQFYNALPRKPRADSLEKIAENVSLPVASDFEFWKLT